MVAVVSLSILLNNPLSTRLTMSLPTSVSSLTGALVGAFLLAFLVAFLVGSLGFKTLTVSFMLKVAYREFGKGATEGGRCFTDFLDNFFVEIFDFFFFK